MNWSATVLGLVPPTGTVAVTSTEPAWPAGEVAVIWVSLSTWKLAAALDPKPTSVTLVNPLPVIVTEVPPVVEP